MWALAAALLAAAPVADAAPVTPDYPPSQMDCPGASAWCRLRHDVEPADLERRLGASDFASWTDGHDLHVVVRADRLPVLCCTIQAPLARVGESDLWTLSLHIPRLEEAVILLGYIHMEGARRIQAQREYRGPKARRPAAASEPLTGRVEELSIDSAALGHASPVGVYRPPPAVGPVEAVIYLADGDVAHYAPVLERLILDGRAPPTLIVGVSAWLAAGEDAVSRSALRNAQYRRGVDPAEMARHDRFVFEEVMPRVEAGLDRRSLVRLAAGASNGGAWAFTTTLARPDLFQGAIAMSPAVRGVDLSGLTGRAGQSCLMTAGLFEGLGNARIAYDHLGEGPARRCLLEGVDGHSPSLYRDFFPLAVQAALRKDGCPRWP